MGVREPQEPLRGRGPREGHGLEKLEAARPGMGWAGLSS